MLDIACNLCPLAFARGFTGDAGGAGCARTAWKARVDAAMAVKVAKVWMGFASLKRSAHGSAIACCDLSAQTGT